MEEDVRASVLGVDGEQAGSSRWRQHHAAGSDGGGDRRDDAKSGRCRELLQRLGGLGSARMGRQQGADFLDHRQGGGRRYGFTENRRTIFTQEQDLRRFAGVIGGLPVPGRSEEHTSEIQSLMRISYAVFGLNKKNKENYA